MESKTNDQRRTYHTLASHHWEANRKRLSAAAFCREYDIGRANITDGDTG
jgi:hypothetical protein